MSRLWVSVYKETSSVDVGLLVLLSKIFLWIQCPRISLLLFKDGADLWKDSFSCKQSLHILSFGANGFTFFDDLPLDLKLVFLFFNIQTCSLSVVEVLLCSNLKDYLCKLNLVLNSLSVSPICVRFLVVRSCCYCCSIYNAFSEVFAVRCAKVFLPTVI